MEAMERNQWRTYRPHLITLGLTAVLVTLLYFVGEVVIPFFLGLAIAYLVNPLIEKIRRAIPNRNLAVSVFLVSGVALAIGLSIFFGSQIIRDFQRLNEAVVSYAQNNSEALDASTQQIKDYIEQIYSPEELQEKLGISGSLDSIDTETLMADLDTDAIGESLQSLGAFFTADEEDDTPAKSSMNWFVIFFSSIAYFLYIIYTYSYFESKFHKYFSGSSNSKIGQFAADFKRTFLSYFKQRSKVVGIFIVLFTVAFLAIGLPGAIIFGILTGLLCYVAYLQYIVLIPLSLGCLVLAMERDQNFFLFFGIVLAVFILMSVLEEMVLFPYVMKDVSSMNPAIMMVSLALWTYLLGIFGLLIGLPLTSLVLIYLDKVLLNRIPSTPEQ